MHATASRAPGFAGDLLVPEAGAEVDFDRTPRHSTFPHDVQNGGPAPMDVFPPMSEQSVQAGMHPTYPGMEQSQDAMDFEAYTVGLVDKGIYPTSLSNMSPYEELAFSEFFVVEPEAH